MAFLSSKSSLNSLLESYNSRIEKKRVALSSVSESTIDDVVKKINAAEMKDLSEEDSPTGEDSGYASADAAKTSSQGEDRKRELARSLIDPGLLWDNFFHELMDETANAVKEDLAEKELKFTHPDEVEQAKRRAERRFSSVCNFPIKLIFAPLKRHQRVANVFAAMLNMHFGPLHVALQVGNVVLDWDDRSLVSPSLLTYKDQLMELDLQPHCKWIEFTARHKSRMRKAARDLNFYEQIELTNILSDEKRSLLGSLILLIIQYNSYYRYDLTNRNCQHFVLDALSVLRVGIPIELSGDLGVYYLGLIRGKSLSVTSQFATHSDLDARVCKKGEEAIANLPQHDLEFLLSLYFHFHLENRGKLNRDKKALELWGCEEAHCCIGEVQRLIMIKSKQIHKF